ncbi:MAG: hypothetical protein PWP23_2485 [Candidatus Sumerlaeota bacterium]|nr:hypothetical protein [Candidatus Sumerlaeota bacterium]
MRHVSITKAKDIERWAESISARSELPRLIRRLVLATNHTCEQINFPCGEQVQRPGFDGRSDCRAASTFVPKGQSVWEMGVTADSKGKADKDFSKRNAELTSRSDASFIFVTPRHWQNKDEWEKSVGASSNFSLVRAYDCNDLEQWLETAPAVDLWFAEQIGIKPQGALDLATHWKGVQASTKPPLPPEVFLCSRKDPVQDLEKWIEGGPGDLAFSAYSPDEVLDFFAAWVASLPEERREELQARTIIVTKPEAWEHYAARQLKDSPGLVLIASSRLSLDQGMIATAVANGHHVLLPVRGIADEQLGKSLNRSYQYELEEALKKGGVEVDIAHRTAKECGGSTSVLKRILASTRHRARPEWASAATLRGLVRLVMAGSWDESNAADRVMIEKLTSKPYAEAVLPIQSLIDAEEAPFLTVGTTLSQATRQPLWELVLPLVTPDDIAAFKSVCMEVLGEIDPTLELKEEERWFASIKGIQHKYSKSLRKGMVETLALLGAGDANSSNATIREFAGHAHAIVRDLLDETGLQQWLSLEPFFQLLAEAAPDTFLSALEKDLRRDSPHCHAFFTDSKDKDSFFSHSAHTQLLWALECVAWSPKFLTRAALILAQLAESDPGGRLANRPAGSLLSLYRAWHPETAATIDKRIESLRTVTERFPEPGKALLVGLLPGQHDWCMNNPRPSVRTWHLERTPLTNRDVAQMHLEAYRLLLARTVWDPQAILLLLEIYPQLSDADALGFEQRMREIASSETPEDVRAEIWEGTMAIVRRHRAFHDAKWAMAREQVDALEELAALFAPTDAVFLGKHLFESDALFRIEDPDNDSAENFERRSKILEEKQVAVLKDLIASGGSEAVIRLIDEVEEPNTVGFLLGRDQLVPLSVILPAALDTESAKRRSAASAYVNGLRVSTGTGWIDALDFGEWTETATVNLLLALPMEKATWDRVAGFAEGIQKSYWQQCGGLLFARDADFQLGNELLLANGRADAVVHNLGMHSRKSPLDLGIATQALEALRSGSASGEIDAQRIGAIRYEIQELFQCLQHSEGRDRATLAGLEFAFLPFLDGHGAAPETLHEMMAEDPGYFLDVFRLAYGLPKVEGSDDIEPVSDEERGRALQAHRLLHSWRRIPGIRDGAVDRSVLLAWVEAVRGTAKEWGCLPLCDSYLGEVLSHAPADEDGYWPCAAVCELMERLSSPELENGMMVGISNQRGVYRKALYEGGDQERALAASKRAMAERIESKYPRAARVLHMVADSYDHSATREDERRRWD